MTNNTSLYLETISEKMSQVMKVFSQTKVSEHFYLADGTALALQLEHRRSLDLDYFSPREEIPSIRYALAQALESLEPLLADAAWGNLVFLAGEVRVGFYGYGYPLVAPLRVEQGIALASLADIGLMKLDALQGRASRKDFHDLYDLCQRIPLQDLLEMAAKKYLSTRDFQTQVVKRFPYFWWAVQEEPLTLLHEVFWETVKAFFRQQACELSQKWMR